MNNSDIDIAFHKAMHGRQYGKQETRDAYEWFELGCNAQPQADKARGLVADDVRWVVNDIAELGVEIGGQCFFLYKGGSLVYEDCKHEDGTTMHYRPVFKREFGECCHPINYSDPTRIGAVSLSDSDAWKPLTYTTPQPQGDASPNPDDEASIDKAWQRFQAAVATPQVSGGGEVEAALMVVNDAANEARHSGDYQRANALVRARVTLARAALSTPQAQQQITADMVREAEAHYPVALDAESTRNSRWHWFADYYNNALAKPNEPCPCCNVTPDGDILDHLARPDGNPQVSDDGEVCWQRSVLLREGHWGQWEQYHDLYNEGRPEMVGRFKCKYRPLYTHPAPDVARLWKFVEQAFDRSKTSTSEIILQSLGLPDDEPHMPLSWHINRALTAAQQKEVTNGQE